MSHAVFNPGSVARLLINEFQHGRGSVVTKSPTFNTRFADFVFSDRCLTPHVIEDLALSLSDARFQKAPNIDLERQLPWNAVYDFLERLVAHGPESNETRAALVTVEDVQRYIVGVGGPAVAYAFYLATKDRAKFNDESLTPAQQRLANFVGTNYRPGPPEPSSSLPSSLMRLPEPKLRTRGGGVVELHGAGTASQSGVTADDILASRADARRTNGFGASLLPLSWF